MDKKTLFVSDLDGTLLNHNKEISAYTTEMINCLTEQGIPFTFATARSFSSANALLKDLHLTTPAITHNGTFVVNQENGAIIHASYFNQTETDYIIKTIKELNYSPLVYSVIDGRERLSWIQGRENKETAGYLYERRQDKRLRAVHSEEELYEGDIYYFTMIGSKEYLEPAKCRFDKDQAADYGFHYFFQEEIYSGGEFWFEIMSQGSTKANAIGWLKNYLNCDRVVCFGDGLNDKAMFEFADEAYAVQNAVTELKEIATEIIQNNTEDGVAKWLAEYFALLFTL